MEEKTCYVFWTNIEEKKQIGIWGCFYIWLWDVREADSGTHSISAGSHVLLGIVVVLNQFSSKLIQGLEIYKTRRLRVYSFSPQYKSRDNCNFKMWICLHNFRAVAIISLLKRRVEHETHNGQTWVTYGDLLFLGTKRLLKVLMFLQQCLYTVQGVTKVFI